MGGLLGKAEVVHLVNHLHYFILFHFITLTLFLLMWFIISDLFL